MKKIILTAAATLTLASSTALAGMEDVFYAKINVGAQKLDDLKVEGNKAKSEVAAFAGLGVGYYVMENFRMELAFDHYFNPAHKVKSSETNAAGKITGTEDITVSTRIDTLMLNGYADVADIGVTKVFVGAGVGAAQLRPGVKVSTKASAGNTNTETGDLNSDAATTAKAAPKIKNKNKHSLAYALHVGVATEFAPGVNGEIFYSYRGFGKGSANGLKAVYKGHHAGLGVRFDL